MFTFPLKWGSANALRDINNIVLSDKMAAKYFGDVNPVGQTGIAIMISVVAFTFSTQIRKVVRSNAVDGLKTE